MFFIAEYAETTEINKIIFPCTLRTLRCMFNPDFAVGFVARRRKPQRNAQLERFCDDYYVGKQNRVVNDNP